MNRNHDTYQEWLHLAVDGELGPTERAGLETHLGECAACREEARRVEALARLLASSRIAVRDGFVGEVMAKLPAAGWEARARQSWWLPLAAALGLAAGAGVVASSSAASAPSLIAAAATLGELFRASLVAGAGLLGASWSGLGLALSELLRGSPLELALFAVMVLGLDVLFVSLWLRGLRAAPKKSSRGPEPGA